MKILLRFSFFAALVLLCGCNGLGSRFGIDGSDYTDAKELSQLKLPPGALPVSTRYDIPTITDPNGPVIYDAVPPDYEQLKRG